MTQFNSAMSYNLNNAIIGTYPDFTIDYANSLLSKGGLAPALNPAATSASAGTVSFTWDDNSVEGNANSTDKAMVLAYNITKGEAVFVTDGAVRTVGSQDLTVPSSYSGDTVQAFIAFVSEDGKELANSRFIGEVTVAS